MKCLIIVFMVFVLIASGGYLYFYESASGATDKISVSPEVVSYDQYIELSSDLDDEKYTLTLDEFIGELKSNDVVILDLRPRMAYDQGHIKGAKHLGADVNESILQKIVPSKETKVLLYCDNSLALTRKLSLTDMSLPQFHALGYKNTYMLEAVRDPTLSPKDVKEELGFVYFDTKKAIAE